MRSSNNKARNCTKCYPVRTAPREVTHGLWMKNATTNAMARIFITFFAFAFLIIQAQAQSTSLPTDRARVQVVSIPDAYNPSGPALKVLRSDTNTPLRAGTAWIWDKPPQEQNESYYASMRSKGLNSVRMILFDIWETEAYVPGPTFTPTDWNDPVYRARQLARMERSVNYASANGMYVIINSHNKIPHYNATYADALWTHVAPYFANRTHVIYEAANEPMDGIGNNGSMTANASDNPANSPRIQALKSTYNLIRAAAPHTHIMILSTPGINDYATGTGLGNLAAAFAAMPGTVDWTKTSVAYHLYNNDRAYGAATNAANLRNLHSRFPGWPSENNFPASVSNETLGITDPWRSAQFDNDIYVNQTCERLGLGWSMWNINGQTQLDRNWPTMIADANSKGWNWTADVLPATPPTFTSPTTATLSQDIAGSHQMSASGGLISFAAVGLPAGLVLNSSTGLITGTTSTAGKINVSVSASNSIGTTTRTLTLDIIPTQDTPLYSQGFGAGNTANWFPYSGGSAGLSASLTNEASGTTDGRVLRLSITAPNSGGYLGTGVTITGTPPFTASQVSRIIVRGRIQVSTPNATNLSVVLKTASNQDFSLPITPTKGSWVDFSEPLASFTANNFHFNAANWEILLVPNFGLWGTGTSTLRLDHIEILRRDDITDPLQSWRKIHFGSATASSGLYANHADFDGDGVNNLLEYALGSIPNNPQFRALPTIEVSSPNIAFTYFRAQPGILYQVERSSDLVTWTSVGVTQSTAPVGQFATATTPYSQGNQSKLFLQLRVTQP